MTDDQEFNPHAASDPANPYSQPEPADEVADPNAELSVEEQVEQVETDRMPEGTLDDSAPDQGQTDAPQGFEQDATTKTTEDAPDQGQATFSGPLLGQIVRAAQVMDVKLETLKADISDLMLGLYESRTVHLMESLGLTEYDITKARGEGSEDELFVGALDAAFRPLSDAPDQEQQQWPHAVPMGFGMNMQVPAYDSQAGHTHMVRFSDPECFEAAINVAVNVAVGYLSGFSKAQTRDGTLVLSFHNQGLDVSIGSECPTMVNRAALTELVTSFCLNVGAALEAAVE